MSASTIVTLICVVLFLYGGTGVAIYKSLTTKHETEEVEASAGD